MRPSRQEPAAITGVGIFSRRFDRELAHGESAPAQRFIYLDALPDLDANDRERLGAGLSSRSVVLACGAARAAAEWANLRAEKCGAAIVISKGLVERLEDGVEQLAREKNALPMTQTIPAICDCGPDIGAKLAAKMLGLGGPASAAVAACASGLASIKLGMDWLRDGVCKTVLAGAAESSHSELVLRSFERLGVISPQGRTRPFDADRDGFVAGEGAAVFRIEDANVAAFNAAKGTGPRVLGRILGLALGADAHHLTTPDMTGAALSRAIETALLRAGLEPAQVGWIHAHGTATAYNDDVEIAALRRVFGKSMPPVTATKGATGHLLGASGALALGITLQALNAGEIPFAMGLENPAPEFEGIDFVTRIPRKSAAKTALILNHGFGGHIAAAVVGIDSK